MDYRRLCRELIAEVRRLRQENDELAAMLEDISGSYEAAKTRATRERRERAIEERRHAEEEYYRWQERQRALDELKRCHERDDDYGYERAIRRLQNAF